ncbi:STE3-domain-containing protein [Ceratobasidium sp. AG-I]|nr:STE3-domain-containing protein [Ceratobasidium sp. AG-I]
MRDPAFPFFCALSIILVLLPLPWHVKVRNTGTLLYIGWTILGNLVFLVNSFVWSENLTNHAPIWCDISTKIIIGLSVGICAASLSINRRLYLIAAQNESRAFRRFTRRDTIIDLCLGIGLPVLVMILHFIVQSHRYDIIEDIGCWPVVYNTLVAVPTVLMWPIIIGSASFIYACHSILAFLRRQSNFGEILANSHTGLNISRYFRLMAMSATEMLFTIPLAIFLLVNNLRGAQNPWVSWADTHSDFGRVGYLSYSFIEEFPQVGTALTITRWALPGSGILFFAFFGMANEAFAEYKRIFWAAAALVGFRRPAPKLQQLDRRSAFGPSGLLITTETTIFPSPRLTLNLGHSSTTIDKPALESDEGELKQPELEYVKLKSRDLESQIGS